jgi:uncharacterized Zn finger protein
MIELVSAEQLDKATERAKASNLLVQPTTIFRQYRVTNRNNGQVYIVNFFVRKDGKRFGNCTCKGSAAGYACKHLAAAAGLHICIAAQKRAA